MSFYFYTYSLFVALVARHIHPSSVLCSVSCGLGLSLIAFLKVDRILPYIHRILILFCLIHELEYSEPMQRCMP